MGLWFTPPWRKHGTLSWFSQLSNAAWWDTSHVQWISISTNHHISVIHILHFPGEEHCPVHFSHWGQEKDMYFFKWRYYLNSACGHKNVCAQLPLGKSSLDCDSNSKASKLAERVLLTLLNRYLAISYLF